MMVFDESSPVAEDWKKMWRDKEQALRARLGKYSDKLDTKGRNLEPLQVGDTVRVQNQCGNYPRKWDRTGIIVRVCEFDMYLVRMDGSRQLTARNRKFLRKFVKYSPEYRPTYGMVDSWKGPIPQQTLSERPLHEQQEEPPSSPVEAPRQVEPTMPVNPVTPRRVTSPGMPSTPVSCPRVMTPARLSMSPVLPTPVTPAPRIPERVRRARDLTVTGISSDGPKKRDIWSRTFVNSRFKKQVVKD